MNRLQFLRELDEIKANRTSSEDPAGISNRLYTVLVDCLAVESKNVEAKLEVLAAVLQYYVELRLGSQNSASPETDAFGHFLFMECSHLVLGMEFHHLSPTDVYKTAFKSAINGVHSRLQGYSIGHVFLVLEWLMINQWSHPTLVAMMKGEDIDRERALTYIGSGEYPELFRLRIQMLIESGCDNYACNLVSWCLQSSIFDSDVSLKATHLLLLHKLGRCEQLHNQCCQMTCCVGREILKYMINRSEEPSFLLLIAQTLLLVNWIKPAPALCCTKELLEFWLSLQRQGEPEDGKFLDSMNKVVVLTQDVKQIVIFIEVLINLFQMEFVQFSCELSLAALKKERQRLDGLRLYEKNERRSSALIKETASVLSKICLLVARLFKQHSPQMYLACILAAFYLEPTDNSYYCAEAGCLELGPSCPVEPLAPPGVTSVVYVGLLECIDALAPAKLHRSLNWAAVKPEALKRLKECGYKYKPDTNSLIFGSARGGRTKSCKPEPSCKLGKLAKISAYMKNSVSCPVGVATLSSSMSSSSSSNCTVSSSGCDGDLAHRMKDSYCDVSSVSCVRDGDLTSSDYCTTAGGRLEQDAGKDGTSDGFARLSTNSSTQQNFARVPTASSYHNFAEHMYDGGGCSVALSGHSHTAHLTLDDIQQVLGGGSSQTVSSMCRDDLLDRDDGEGEEEEDRGGSTGVDLGVDESALNEITAYLQSEFCRQSDGSTFGSFLMGNTSVPSQQTFLSHSSHYSRGSSAMDETITSDTGDGYLPRFQQFSYDREEGMPAHSALQLDPAGMLGSTGASAVLGHANASGAPRSTILVTETNLPYLQQFLPNLQTVMQSVQSFVSGRSPHPPAPVTSRHTDATDTVSYSLMNGIDSSASLNEPVESSKRKNVDSCDYMSSDGGNVSKKFSPSDHSGQMKGRNGKTEMGMVVDNFSNTLMTHSDSSHLGNGRHEKSVESSVDGGSGSATTKNYYCRFCKKGFACLDERRHHTKFSCDSKKNCVDTSLKCDVCGKLFDSKHGRTTHMNRVHGIGRSTPIKQAAASEMPCSASPSVTDVAGRGVESGRPDLLAKDHKTSSSEFKPMSSGDDKSSSLRDVQPLLSDPRLDDDVKVSVTGVHLPEDVTLKDCFVKVLRLDDGLKVSTIEQQQADEGTDSPLSTHRENISAVESASAAVMCDGCGMLLRDLNGHARQCVGRNSQVCERPSNEEGMVRRDVSCVTQLLRPPSTVTSAYSSMGTENNNLLLSTPIYSAVSSVTTPSVYAGRPAGNVMTRSNEGHASPSAATVRSSAGKMIEDQVVVSHTASNQDMFSGQMTMPSINQEAMLEMLQIADHFLRVNAIGQGASPDTSGIVVGNQGIGRNSELEQQPSDSSVTLPPPPSYDIAVASRCTSAAQTVRGPMPPVSMATAASVSNGKEILYEGTRMLESVEYQCDVCLLTFSTGDDASRHVVTGDHTHASVASYHIYRCADCGIKYRDKQVMRNHSLYLCTTASDARLRTSAMNQGGVGVNVANQQQMMTAGVIEVNGATLNQGSGVNGAAPLTRIIGEDGGIVQGRLHMCKICFKIFIGEEYLRAHERLKHSSVPVSCSATGSMAGISLTSGSMASGSMASGSMASGSMANGSMTSGSLASGAIAMQQIEEVARREFARSYAQVNGEERQVSCSASVCGSVVTSTACSMSEAWVPASSALDLPKPGSAITWSSVPVLSAEMDAVQYRRNVEHYPALFDATFMTNLYNGGVHPRQPYAVQTPTAVTIPTLEQLKAGLNRFTPALLQQQPVINDLDSHSVGTDSPCNIPEGTPLSAAQDSSENTSQTTTCYSPGSSKTGASLRAAKAKGIYYKNVLMQCEGTYYCSVCKQDLSTRDAKKSHRLLPCGDPKTVTYSRRYSYLCPYCAARFPSQKLCREHQIADCLRSIGVGAEELRVREMGCPLCPKKYFNLIPLKGHMTQVHKMARNETREMLDRLGYVEEMFDRRLLQLPSGSVVTCSRSVGAHQPSLCNLPAGGGSISGVTDQEFGSFFDLDNDVSSELAAHAEEMLMTPADDALMSSTDAYEQCDDMDVMYDDAMFSDREDDASISSAVALAESRLSAENVSGETDMRLNGSVGGISSSGSLSPVSVCLGPVARPVEAVLDQPCTPSPAEICGGIDAVQRRRKTRNANEFFVMMFRNYPILAKGVSMCGVCEKQVTSSSEVEDHAKSGCSAGGGDSDNGAHPPAIKRSTLFKCTHCEETFWKAKSCRQHQIESCLPAKGISVTGLMQPSVACPLCSTKSYNRSGLMSHMKYKHSMDTNGVRECMVRYGIEKKAVDATSTTVCPLSNGLLVSNFGELQGPDGRATAATRKSIDGVVKQKSNKHSNSCFVERSTAQEIKQLDAVNCVGGELTIGSNTTLGVTADNALCNTQQLLLTVAPPMNGCVVQSDVESVGTTTSDLCTSDSSAVIEVVERISCAVNGLTKPQSPAVRADLDDTQNNSRASRQTSPHNSELLYGRQGNDVSNPVHCDESVCWMVEMTEVPAASQRTHVLNVDSAADQAKGLLLDCCPLKTDSDGLEDSHLINGVTNKIQDSPSLRSITCNGSCEQSNSTLSSLSPVRGLLQSSELNQSTDDATSADVSTMLPTEVADCCADPLQPADRADAVHDSTGLATALTSLYNTPDAATNDVMCESLAYTCSGTDSNIANSMASNDITNCVASSDITNSIACSDIANNVTSSDMAINEFANSMASNDIAGSVAGSDIANSAASSSIASSVASSDVGSVSPISGGMLFFPSSRPAAVHASLLLQYDQ